MEVCRKGELVALMLLCGGRRTKRQLMTMGRIWVWSSYCVGDSVAVCERGGGASWVVCCTGDGERKRPFYDEKTSFVRCSFRNRPGRTVKQIDIDQIRRGREEKIWVGRKGPSLATTAAQCDGERARREG